MKMQLFNFPLPVELLDQVKLYCKQNRISYAEFMRRAIKAKLKIKLPDYCTCPKCFDILPDEVKSNYHPLT